jgi:tetratricopeptide (TPR) repeat protein
MLIKTLKLNTNLKILLSFAIIFSACTSTKQSQVDSNYNRSLDRAKDYIEYYSDESIDNEAEFHFINGLTQQQKGNFAESLIDFNQALQADSSAAILYSMAKSYYQLNRLELTLETLVRSIEIQDDFVPSMELLSSIYFRLNDISNAIAINEKIISIDPSYSRKLELAELYESHNTEKAKELYEELYETSKDKFVLRKLTELYSTEKESETYSNLLEELYFINKSNANIGLELLDLYLEKKEYKKSFELLNSADTNIATEKLTTIYGTLGYSILRENNLDSTILNNFISRIDNRFFFDWRIQMLTAYLESKRNNYGSALKRFENAFKLNPSKPDLYIDAGTFFMQNSKVEYGEKVFQLGVEKFPNSADLNYLYGLSLDKKYEKAITYFKKATKINSSFIEAYIQLGLIYDNQNNLDSTVYYYTKALDLDPKNPVVNNNFAYTLSVRGKKLDEALKMSKIALEFEPESAIYLDTYGWILYKMGNPEKALKYVRSAIDKGGISAEVYEHLGEILQTLERNDEALEAFRNALKIDPNRQSIRDNINNLE